ncbi:MAG: phosphate regulon transcriptional regulator PhoB [Pseudomonadota bacterium]
MNSKHILVVEDEPAIREMVAFNLKRAGYDVSEAGDTASARSAVADKVPDLMLVDWMLPDTSGLEFIRAIRKDKELRDTPVIMITAKSAEEDKIRGLEGGADDYLTKPFSHKELLARIKAVLRRSSPGSADEILNVEGLTVDLGSHRVSFDGKTLTLGPTEFRLLSFFMSHPERVYSRSQLLDRIWGGNVYVEERTVDVHIRRLRKTLSLYNCDKFIQTVRGAGYRFSTK